MIGGTKTDHLANQLFRRIGYTNGLANLLRFGEVCRVIGSKPRGSKEVARNLEELFEVGAADAKGKLDVAEALGLIQHIAGRHSLTAMGRALVALEQIYGKNSREVVAFFFRRVVQNDADYLLTLLLTLSKRGPKFTPDEYAAAVDRLLTLKQDRIAAGRFPIMVRRLADEKLVVLWRKPARTALERAQIKRETESSRYRNIRLPPDVLPTWERHTVDPRRGWLVDLGLTERSTEGHRLTGVGAALVSYLEQVAEASEGFAVIDVEATLLREVAFMEHLVSQVPVTPEYWDTMTSVAMSGKVPELQSIDSQLFLEALTQGYERTRLEQFQQAEAVGLREIIQLPFLTRGARVDFNLQLETLLRLRPDKISRLASPRDPSAYISIKGGVPN